MGCQYHSLMQPPITHVRFVAELSTCRSVEKTKCSTVMFGSELRGGVGKNATSAATELKRVIARTTVQMLFICRHTISRTVAH